MNKEFIDALEQIALERNIKREQILENFEASLEQAYERNVEPGKQIEVQINPSTGMMEVLVIRRVVEVVEDEDKEISLEEALDLDPDGDIEVGMEMEFPVDPDRFTRIAVQTAKQVINQRNREAERDLVYEEYKDRAGEVINATVSRVDNKRNVFIDLGRGEAIMPPREQIPGENYRVSMPLKVYIAKVEKSNRGPSILVSRGAPELLEYLMTQEVPEVSDGTVELKAIAREAGQRSKVAVISNNPNVDPIGACIGHRGSRIQAITSELQRERVDIIMWDNNPREFIKNALSPAKVGAIILEYPEPPAPIKAEDSQAKVENSKASEGEVAAEIPRIPDPTATIHVANDQLSLAIGKGGQNVRLAAKLTGYKIDLVESENASTLDAAMQAATDEHNMPATDEGKKAAFDALFANNEATEDSKEAEAQEVEYKAPANDALSEVLAEADNTDTNDALNDTSEYNLDQDALEAALNAAAQDNKTSNTPEHDPIADILKDSAEEG